MSTQQDEIINGMLALQGALYRERLSKLMVLGMALGITLGLALLARRFPIDGLAFFATLALISALGALWLLRNIMQEWQPKRCPIFVQLHQKPQSIVWVYALAVQRMPFGLPLPVQENLVLALDNGERLELRVKPWESQQILRALRHLLPQASFGYSLAKQQYYDLDPNLLREDV
jgi:hypothetical protein